jgi:outer membrane receptor protein involved in Fe transport
VRLDARLVKQEDLHRAFFLEVSNLLDKRYEPYLGYPAPGRRVWAGVEYRF